MFLSDARWADGVQVRYPLPVQGTGGRSSLPGGDTATAGCMQCCPTHGLPIQVQEQGCVGDPFQASWHTGKQALILRVGICFPTPAREAAHEQFPCSCGKAVL